ncbi:MAG: hypothetical protein FJ405_05725 [Verrucomicrobia bacterium]|nr:hypothetical protein [Verrucomicrobiota bacterium]
MSQEVLISTNTAWKYLSQPTEVLDDWKSLDYVDTEWAEGLSSLGFGRPVTTVIPGGPSAARHPTIYFRKQFEISNPAAYASITAAFRRDDGLAVYLNGVEQFRNGLPGVVGDPIAFTQLATSAADNGSTWFTNRLNLSDLLPGPNVIAVEVHQTSAGSSDLVLDFALIGFAQPIPPAVSMTMPADNLTIPAKSLLLLAAVSDPDDAISKVEFYNGDQQIVELVTPPYRHVWSDLAPGDYSITARATDASGLVSTSAPSRIKLLPALVQLGSSWSYMDDGLAQPIDWRDAAFDDSSWSIGWGEFGYGDGDESTVVLFGGNPNVKNITTYFRHAFEVADAGAVNGLSVSLRRDDGAVVYLNGMEVLRSGMPEDVEIFHETLARDTAGDLAETALLSKRVDPSLLASGRNVLAVEVHQAALTSSDLSFDLLLRMNPPSTPSVIAITNPAPGQTYMEPANITFGIHAADEDSAIVSVELLENGEVIGLPDLIFPYAIAVQGFAAGTHTIVARATDEQGEVALSAPFTFTVVKPAVIATLVPTGANWRYLDDGSDQQTAWIAPDFDDSSWPEGLAELGFGDNRDVTRLTSGHITYYFRHGFSFEGPNTATNLLFRVRRDDGVAIYLNGEPVGRNNLPAGDLLFNTPAGPDTDPETDFRLLWAPASLLRVGWNVVAAEVHQTSAGSSDVSFDLSLETYSDPNPADPPPTLSLERLPQGGYQLTWQGQGWALQEASALPAVSWTPVVGALSPHAVQPSGAQKFYRLIQQ